nr:hypothetical protein [Tanacetum cinerariifolium]
KSKVRQSRAKAVVAKVNSSSSTPAISTDVAELKDMVRALLLDKKNQSSAQATSSTPAPIKAVESNCVTCGGTHSYQHCPATSGNVYQDNINESSGPRPQGNSMRLPFRPTGHKPYGPSMNPRRPTMNEPKEIPELMYKLREDVRNIKEELAEYIDSSIGNCPIFFCDEDEEYTIQYREYLEKSPDAVTIILPTEEPEYSLSMRYEHFSTILETESDEVIEFSAKNLLPIPSEYDVTSDDESECDMPDKDESSSVFTTFSNPLFNDNDYFTSSDDESLSEEDVLIEEFKVYSNPLFNDDEINSDEIDPHCFNVESDFVESLSNRDTLIDSSSKINFLE